MRFSGQGWFDLNGRKVSTQYDLVVSREGTLYRVDGTIRPLHERMFSVFNHAGMQALTLNLEDGSTLRFYFKDSDGAIIGTGPIVSPSNS
jgi:hypothetical protein